MSALRCLACSGIAALCPARAEPATFVAARHASSAVIALPHEPPLPLVAAAMGGRGLDTAAAGLPPAVSAFCLPCADSSRCPPALDRALQRCVACVMTRVPPKLRKRRGCGTGEQHKYWLNVDPCGIICASFTWCIVLYCCWAFTTQALVPWYRDSPVLGAFHVLAFHTLAGLGLVSHARAMLSSPGAVPRTSRPTTPEGWNRTCHKCDNHKPARAHHCSICGRCVIKMDREWVGSVGWGGVRVGVGGGAAILGEE